jgi:predicted tellurium resistance membrane protein TerC
MNLLMDPSVWLALLTLSALEIVLGIDNIIFIAILAGKLPEHQRTKGRTVGLLLAMVTRILLLFSITLIMRLTQPFFTVFTIAFSGRDLILIAGGLFLLGKSTVEIHSSLEGEEDHTQPHHQKRATFFSVVTQIMILDIVFSLDSVITAIGLAQHLGVMIAAIMLAVVVMIFLAGSISSFVESHPTIKILALSFLLLIGVSLVGEGIDLHIPKGYIYFAMSFSVLVEILNMRMRKRRPEPLQLRKPLSAKL